MVVPSADVVFSTSSSPARVVLSRGRLPQGAGIIGDGQDGEEADQEQDGQGHGAPAGGWPPRSAGPLWVLRGFVVSRLSGPSSGGCGVLAAGNAGRHGR